MRQAALLVAAFLAGLIVMAFASPLDETPVVTDMVVFEDGSFLLETPDGDISGCIPTQLCDQNIDYGDLFHEKWLETQ